jgi:hypothetical protein
MKSSNFLVINLLILLSLLFSLQLNAQIGIGTTTPDASSMLDIQSDAKGVLIPRMTTAQRLLVEDPVTGEPANGLLVFDTDTQSFWFYESSSWKELGLGGSIHDTDGDTKIEVEKVTDTDPNGDEINFSTNGNERMKIDRNGVIILGDSSATTKNYTKITTDGSLSYVGDATRWDDLKVPVNSIRVKNIDIDPAVWKDFIGETALLAFEDRNASSERSVTFTVQMPHGWKEGSDIMPHVHWSAEVAPVGERVYWALEYTWINVGGNFPATTTIKSNSVATPNGTSISAYEHVITPLGTISGSGNTLSSMIVCRLYRNSSDNSNDTFIGEDAMLLEIDFHYQIDSDGSHEEYIKW